MIGMEGEVVAGEGSVGGPIAAIATTEDGAKEEDEEEEEVTGGCDRERG